MIPIVLFNIKKKWNYLLLHNLFTFSYGIVTKPIAIGLGLEKEKEPILSFMNMFKKNIEKVGKSIFTQ